MTATTAFDHVCEALEHATSLDRLQCRGTIRLVLKEAGLDVARVQPNEMAVVVRRLLPAALRSRGVDAPEPLCEELARGLASVETAPVAESPDAVFRRLGGG
jgi:hypothetical protein